MYLCIVNKINIMIRNFDFDSYRRWFNKHFSLSYNGKFCGLLRLREKGVFELFVHKLASLLRRFENKRHCSLGDIITMKVKGTAVKLYLR